MTAFWRVRCMLPPPQVLPHAVQPPQVAHLHWMGQLLYLQAWTSLATPMHSLPPFFGCVATPLVREVLPHPHVAEQRSNAPHGSQTQLIGSGGPVELLLSQSELLILVSPASSCIRPSLAPRLVPTVMLALLTVMAVLPWASSPLSAFSLSAMALSADPLPSDALRSRSTTEMWDFKSRRAPARPSESDALVFAVWYGGGCRDARGDASASALPCS
mmetsp:Transcript_98455/g.303483  ORF Transcript_98455/g.303483 Transcript_98455/m.303483 type:complete len:216 (-) Transcript_98455:91-738(-)